MKIKELHLINIGPYIGDNLFDFNTADDKNIIMIGGKNGAGKTTLLKSIKIGLFGCFAYGFKTENSTYFKEVESLLSNYASSNDYRIKIRLEYVEKLSRDEYQIIRHWKLNNGEIVEFVQVIRNNIDLDSVGALEFINKMRSITSPALINSFIFDGEKIGSIIESSQTSEYIKSVFNSIFNIDLLDQFQGDLTTYLNSDSGDSSDNEYELTTLLNQINACKAELRNETDHLQNIKNKIQDIKTKIDSAQKEFMILGGVSKDRILQYQSCAKSLETESEKNNKILRDFYEDYLPYCIALDQLKAIKKQAKEELPVVYAEMLRKIQAYLHEPMEKYLERLKTPNKVLFKLPEEEIAEIDNLISVVKKQKKTALKIMSNKNDLTNSLLKIRRTIEDNVSIERLDEIIELVSKLSAELSILKNDEIETTDKIDELETNRDILIRRYEELLDKSKKEKSLGNSYILCVNTLKACDALKEYLKEKKLKMVSQACYNLFNETIRKNNFITDISIDNDFTLRLHSNKKQVNESYLSAGERQILISCIIWAMFKISGRREMFIFDTPLARLDEENRAGFAKNIISTISGQVIVLSTDSEFVDSSYQLISDKIARNYLLNYDDYAKATTIQEKYFGE